LLCSHLCSHAARCCRVVAADLLRRAVEVTDADTALFNAAHGFADCIAALHEVLRRQGLFEGIERLDVREVFLPRQN